MAFSWLKKVKQAEVDWLQQVKDKEKDLKDWHDRLDKDRKLYYYHKNLFKLLNTREEPVKGARNTTLPDPRFFADKVIASLKSAKIRKEIKGETLDDKVASECERFFDSLIDLADEHLSYAGVRGGIKGAWSSQSPLRGCIYTKVWPFEKDGKYFPGIVPWDSRFCSHEFARDGLAWADCRMRRSKAQINADYPEANFRSDKGEVIDIITPEEEIIYIEDQEYKPKGKRLKNPWGFVPVVIEYNDNGAFMRDDGYLEHEGESIYASVRDLYPVLNEYVTILRSINVRTFLYNYIFESDHPNIKPFETDPHDESQVLPLLKGEKLTPEIIQDIKQATVYFYQMIETRQQRGSLPATDYADLHFQLSAVAIKQLGEARNGVLYPCLDTIARAWKSLYKIILKQMQMSNFKIDGITVPNLSALKNDYSIEVFLDSITPLENIANWSAAAAARPWLGRYKTLAEVVHDPNPAETIQDIYIEEAEELTPQSPPLKIWRTAEALLSKKADGDQAKKLQIQAAFTVGLLGMTIEEFRAQKVEEGKLYQPLAQEQPPLLTMPEIYGANRAAPGQKSSNKEAAEMKTQLGMEG